MAKKKASTEPKITWYEATQRHRAVLAFLQDENLTLSLLDGLKPGVQRAMGLRLATEPRPILIRDLAEFAGVSEERISQVRPDLDKYFGEFFATNSLLSTTRIRVRIPGSGKSEDTRFGYYLAFYDLENNRFSTSDETKEIRKRIYFDRIRSVLQDKLRKEASATFSRKLEDPSEYQPLGVEIGVFEQTPDADTSDTIAGSKPETSQPRRTWKRVSQSFLLNLSGQYILVSEAGTGKTTLLSWLQGKILETDGRLPILIHAAEIERWTYKSLRGFLTNVATWMELGIGQEWVASFLEEQTKKSIILLVDGLDQITGEGTQYESFLSSLFQVCGEGHVTVLVASRPTAVVCVEDDPNISFVRLKPFGQTAKRVYFGRHYDRARDLCSQDQDMLGVPMLAYMIRQLIRTGRDKHIDTRASLYAEFVEYVLYKPRPEGVPVLIDEREAAKELLQKISFGALAERKPYIQTVPLEFCKQFTPHKGLTVDRLLKFGLVTLVIDRSERTRKSLCFTHQSFQEYLAAKELAAMSDPLDVALGHVYDAPWKEVLVMFGGILGDPGTYVAALLKKNREDLFFRPLLLAIQVIQECDLVHVPRGLVKGLANAVLRVVQDPSLVLLWMGMLRGMQRVPGSDARLGALLGAGQCDRMEFLSQFLMRMHHDRETSERWQALEYDAPLPYRIALHILGRDWTDETLPALVRGVSHPDRGVQEAVIMTLGKIGSELAIRTLIQAVPDVNGLLRAGIILALSETESEDVVPFLVQALQDIEPAVRRTAVNGLCCSSSEQVVASLVQAIDNPHPEVRKAVVNALGQRGGEGVLPLLISALEDEDQHVREAALDALGDIGAEEAIPSLVRVLRNGGWSTRKKAVEVLGRIHLDKVIALLISLLGQDNASREHVVEALGWLQAKEAVGSLVEMLQDENDAVRQSVADALGNIGSEYAVPALIQALDDRDHSVQSSAILSLGKIGSEDATVALLRFLQREGTSMSRVMARALANSDSDLAIPALMGALRDEDFVVVRIAAQRLVSIDSERAILALSDVLKSGNVGARLVAIEALGGTCLKEALPALTQCLQDPNPHLREEAALALGQTGLEEAAPALIQALQDTDAHVVRVAVCSLGRIGVPGAVPAVTKLLADGDLLICKAAALSLSMIRLEMAMPELVRALDYCRVTNYRDLFDALSKIAVNRPVPTPNQISVDEMTPFTGALLDAQRGLQELADTLNDLAQLCKGKEKPR